VPADRHVEFARLEVFVGAPALHENVRLPRVHAQDPEVKRPVPEAFAVYERARFARAGRSAKSVEDVEEFGGFGGARRVHGHATIPVLVAQLWFREEACTG
jgi:hypothetical protein